MKPHLKVQFSDFWQDFSYMDSFFYQIMIPYFNIEISNNPDILFYSNFGNDHIKYSCTKIFYTGENIRPNFKQCDFAFSFDHNPDPKNYRLPLYALYDDVNKLITNRIDPEEILAQKRKFCCFVVSNPEGKVRNDFFKKFSEFSHIDSGGRLFNNIGTSVTDKRLFLKDYKFVIAFENTSYPGYITEKIFEPFLEHCIPIYWGDENVDKEFNSKSFINCHDFESFENVIARVLEVDNNDELYMQYLREPIFHKNIVPEYLRNDKILDHLNKIVQFEKKKTLLIASKQFLRFLSLSLIYHFKKNSGAVISRLKRL